MEYPLPGGGTIKQVERDGQTVWRLLCPQCRHWGDLDDDQLHGRVSADHSDCPCGCAYHETHDFYTEAGLA